MKILLSKSVGGPDTLVLENLPDPVPGPREVVVKVKAVGINFPDTLIIQDLYQFKPERPFAPGGEVSGIVETLGSEVNGVEVGARVTAVPGWGGLAEKIVVPANSLIPMPDAMSFEEGAALVMTYGTSYYGLKNRAQLKSGETLLVLGAAGGVGAAAIELGKAMGATVVAAVSSDDKLAFARSLGADTGVVYPREVKDKAIQRELTGSFKQVTAPNGADVVYDGVGGSYAEPALRSMNWYGRYLVVGFPAGIPALPLNLTLLKSVSVIGVFWGAAVKRNPTGHAENMADLMRFYAEGKIKPRISETFTLERAGDAITALGQRSAKGKIVVVMD